MATFYETKQFVCELLGNRDVKDNDEDIVVTLHGGRMSRENLQRNIHQFTVSNFELQELYNKVASNNLEGLEMFSDTGYEIGMNLDYLTIRNQELPIVSIDKANGIKYELGYPTAEYSIYLLMLVKDAMNMQKRRPSRVLQMRGRRFMDLERVFSDSSEITFLKVLPFITGELSLKITSINGVSNTLTKFRKHKTSFVFEFIYRSNVALLEYTDILEIFRMNSTIHERFDITQINTPPLREYTTDVVDYYKLALSSYDSYIKYISFYHVLEYFFDEVFKKKIVNDLKDKITHPDFSYKNDDELYEVAKFVRNRWYMNDELGQGNELESLKYVLNEYISIDELKTRINAIDSTAVTFYQENKVTFCKAPTLSWSDSQGIFTQLAKRIYYTRNSLVHSKSSKNEKRYRPYKDEKQLQSEIPLLRATAELIIINSSQIV